jgi:hypothetical protein
MKREIRVERCFVVTGIAILGLVLWMTCKKRDQSPSYFYATYGGSGGDVGTSVQQASDGGFVVAGLTRSYGAGDWDIWLVKAGATGDKVWDKTFGGTGDDEGHSVEQTSDGGYVITGFTTSNGADSGDVWLIRTDASGNKLWDKTFGGSGDDEGNSVQQTSDGGYIIAGYTSSFGAGNYDAWLIKTDADGNKLWDKTFGGTDDDQGFSVQQTSDGGYVLTGFTHSSGAVMGDVWLIKTDSSGNKVWDRTYGGSGGDAGWSVRQTTDGGYIIAGSTNSIPGGGGAWLIKTDTSGNKVWDRTFGTRGDEYAYSVRQTSDGGYILTGNTAVAGVHICNVWLVKTDSTGNKVWDRTFGGANDDSGCWVEQIADGGYIIAGWTESSGAGSSDVLLIRTDADGN